MRHDIASYEAPENLFGRIPLFLQRLDHCTVVPFTPEMTELLAKIMAQILSVLAFSTKEINGRRISRSFHSISFLADYGIEKFMKIVEKTKVEDAFRRLDLLTKEENLTMMVAGNLGDIHYFDDEATILVEEISRDVDDTVKVTKCGVSHPFNFFIYILIFTRHVL